MSPPFFPVLHSIFQLPVRFYSGVFHHSLRAWIIPGQFPFPIFLPLLRLFKSFMLGPFLIMSVRFALFFLETKRNPYIDFRVFIPVKTSQFILPFPSTEVVTLFSNTALLRKRLFWLSAFVVAQVSVLHEPFFIGTPRQGRPRGI